MKKPKRAFKQNRIFTQNNPLSPRVCPELASEIGLSESILLLQYEFWIATQGEEREGNLWVRKTVREVKEVFSFWGTSTINRLINNLVDAGFMIADSLDDGDRKNGRWLRFGFEKLTTLKSIKIICAETGQTICADLGGISPEMAQDTTQNGTNNGNAPYREERDQENKDHLRPLSGLDLLRDVAQSFPSKESRERYLGILGGAPSEKLLRECRAEWIDRGYNKVSWKWFTEWYAQGGIPEPNGKPKANGKRYTQHGEEIIEETEDYLAVMGPDGTPTYRGKTAKGMAMHSNYPIEVFEQSFK